MADEPEKTFDIGAIIEREMDMATSEEMAKWENLKQRMQGAFQVLRGEAIPFDIERAREMLYGEWADHQSFLREERRWARDEKREPETEKDIEPER